MGEDREKTPFFAKTRKKHGSKRVCVALKYFAESANCSGNPPDELAIQGKMQGKSSSGTTIGSQLWILALAAK